MSFEYRNTLINLLDTPATKNFAEDTYRTLTAVDSVVFNRLCKRSRGANQAPYGSMQDEGYTGYSFL